MLLSVAIAWMLVIPSMGQSLFVATVREAALVPVEIGRTKSAAPRLVVEVRRFEPASDDAVEGLVQLTKGAAGPLLLGRFGLFPNERFVAPSPADSLRYQVAVSPSDAELIREAGTVAIKLRGLRGRGEGASVEIGRVTLELRGE